MNRKFNQKFLLRRLTALLGEDRVAVDPANRLLYSRDMMSRNVLEMKAGEPPHLPDLICWPETSEEVSKILHLASLHQAPPVPVIPFGAGSGVSGGTLPILGGIMLDLKRMSHVGKVQEKEGPFPYSVVAESGVMGQRLEEELNIQGFTLGHFPSSIMCATLGGYLACRSAGQLSSRYGKIEDMVEDVEVVLPNGEIIPMGKNIRQFPKIRTKDLVVGAEGCLGIITKARLKVRPLAPAARYRGISFNRLENGLQAIREILQAGLRPSVVRLYDPLDTLLLSHGYKNEDDDKPGFFNSILKSLLSRLPIPREALKIGAHQFLIEHPLAIQRIASLLPTEVLLILGFEGDAELIEAQEETALAICKKSICKDLGEGPGLHWLKHRYSISYKMPKIFEMDAFVDTIEVASTWDKLPDLYHKMRKVLTPEAFLLAHFSHAYPEGCSIYFTFVSRKGSAKKDLKSYNEIWNEAMESCLKAGGTISHHHGIGLLKAKFLPQELNGAMSFYRDIKKKLDPMNLMNPGKMGL